MRSIRTKTWQKLTALLAIIVLAPTLSIWWNNRTYHLAPVQDGVLYRAGNRGIGELENALQRDRIKTVVSLVDDNEMNDGSKPQFKEEEKYLAANNIKLVRIPVKLGGWPGGDDVKRFLAVVADPENRPVLVHCAQGVRRTGMFVAAYEESAMGYDKAKAKDAIESFGHGARVSDDIRAFIDDYDPATMSMATTRPTTGNE